MAYDCFPLPPFLKYYEPVGTTEIHGIWANRMLLLLIYWRKLRILNYTMRNSLTINFQPLFHLLLILMILFGCQLHLFLLFHRWLNSITKLTLVLHNHPSRRWIIFFRILSFLLSCINILLKQITSSSSKPSWIWDPQDWFVTYRGLSYYFPLSSSCW